MRAAGIWAALLGAMAVPIAVAMGSPLLAWREPVYIIAGFAGILGLALMLIQPLLAAGALPGVPLPRGRRVHRVVGGTLVALVGLHVIGLWITSPPDVVDALLFVSPTPFAVWGVIAMWAVLGAALLAVLRRRLRLSPRHWRRAHTALVLLTVVGTVLHAVQIEGPMEQVSKVMLCAAALVVTLGIVVRLRTWAPRRAGP